MTSARPKISFSFRKQVEVGAKRIAEFKQNGRALIGFEQYCETSSCEKKGCSLVLFSILAEAERKKRLGVFAEITIYASKRMRITG